MKVLAYIALIYLPFLCNAQDSLSGLEAYAFPDFRDMDTAYQSTYPFVHYEVNNYKFYTEKSPNFETFYRKMSNIIETKKGKLNVYHIGGSHIQADIYSHDAREFLQSNWDGAQGERGWVFPFDLARTNNPGNYEFSSPNSWRAYRSVVHKPSKHGID